AISFEKSSPFPRFNPEIPSRNLECYGFEWRINSGDRLLTKLKTTHRFIKQRDAYSEKTDFYPYR
ncbi:MAG: hypothetical protein O1I87_06540, partial [Cylindrospermopsis raciborskii PAMP2012]|uniref:hypothetical protein n=1 Tax=Cylindrospermopsis raciborskii TaxID=77022 RepID=UPI0022C88BBD